MSSSVLQGQEKIKQHACASSGLHDHYSELFTWMAGLNFQNAVAQLVL